MGSFSHGTFYQTVKVSQPHSGGARLSSLRAILSMLGSSAPFRRHRSASSLRRSGSRLPANHVLITRSGMLRSRASEQAMPLALAIERVGRFSEIGKAEGLAGHVQGAATR